MDQNSQMFYQLLKNHLAHLNYNAIFESLDNLQ